MEKESRGRQREGAERAGEEQSRLSTGAPVNFGMGADGKPITFGNRDTKYFCQSVNNIFTQTALNA